MISSCNLELGLEYLANLFNNESDEFIKNYSMIDSEFLAMFNGDKQLISKHFCFPFFHYSYNQTYYEKNQFYASLVISHRKIIKQNRLILVVIALTILVFLIVLTKSV